MLRKITQVFAVGIVSLTTLICGYMFGLYIEHPIALKAACELGLGAGCTNMADILNDDKTKEKNYELILQYYQKGCALDQGSGCTSLGNLYFRGHGTEQNYSLAYNAYKDGCWGGSPIGCSNLGILYQHGYGVAQNDSQARFFFKKACKDGFAKGCARLGEFHQDNDEQVGGFELARFYFEMGCDQDDGRSCYGLGTTHQIGAGIDANTEEAVLIFRKAFTLQYAPGCVAAAKLLAGGKDPNRSQRVIRRLIETACELQHEQACDLLDGQGEIGRI